MGISLYERKSQKKQVWTQTNEGNILFDPPNRLAMDLGLCENFITFTFIQQKENDIMGG